jgi:hypothetical protein
MQFLVAAAIFALGYLTAVFDLHLLGISVFWQLTAALQTVSVYLRMFCLYYITVEIISDCFGRTLSVVYTTGNSN